MKKIKYISLSGIVLLLISIVFAACVDKNEWDTDSSYDRLFSPSKLSTSVSETETELSWTSAPGTEYYLIQVSQDSLYDEVDLNSVTGLITFGEDKSITKSPFSLTGLEGDTKYYLRMKGLSSVKESKWSYPDTRSFKTKSEQIMEEVGPGDRTESTATIKWTAGATVTHLEMQKGEETPQTITLTDEQKAAGTITLTGLEALTTYTVTLFNDATKRGSVTFQTAANVPSEGHPVYLAATDSINTSLFTDLMAQGHDNVTIILPSGSAYYTTAVVKLPAGMSVTFFGLSIKPVIAVELFELAASHARIKFENVELTGKSQMPDGTPKTHNYVFNQSTATSVGAIEFNDCIIRDFANSPVRLQSSDAKVIDSLIFENCMVYGPTARTYSIVHVGGGGKIENIVMNNSTFVNSGKSLIYHVDANFTSAKITNCTLSKVPGAGDYILESTASFGPSQGVQISNCIFGSIGGATAKGIRTSGTVTVTNTYKTTDWSTNGNGIANLIDYEGSEANLFVDPANNDFHIKDQSFAGKNDAGDPRWR